MTNCWQYLYENLLTSVIVQQINIQQSNPKTLALQFVLTYNRGFQVNKDRPGNILPCPRLAEEGGEGVIVASHRLAAGHLSVRLDAVLKTVELPAGVPHLDTGLAYMDRDAFTLGEDGEGQSEQEGRGGGQRGCSEQSGESGKAGKGENISNFVLFHSNEMRQRYISIDTFCHESFSFRHKGTFWNSATRGRRGAIGKRLNFGEQNRLAAAVTECHVLIMRKATEKEESGPSNNMHHLKNGQIKGFETANCVVFCIKNLSWNEKSYNMNMWLFKENWKTARKVLDDFKIYFLPSSSSSLLNLATRWSHDREDEMVQNVGFITWSEII